MKIRLLNAADEEEWAQWVHRYLQTQLENVPEWENNPQRARAAVPGLSFEPLSKQLQQQSSSLFLRLVAEEDRELLGQVLAEKRKEVDGAYLYIHNLYILADYRRKGKGTALLQAALDWGKELGLKEAYIAFHLKNASIQALLKGLGFQALEQLYNGVYENWIWRKTL